MPKETEEESAEAYAERIMEPVWDGFAALVNSLLKNSEDGDYPAREAVNDELEKLTHALVLTGRHIRDNFIDDAEEREEEKRVMLRGRIEL